MQRKKNENKKKHYIFLNLQINFSFFFTLQIIKRKGQRAIQRKKTNSFVLWVTKLLRSSIAYETVEPALRTGDIIFYNDNSLESSSIQRYVSTPNEVRLERARLLASFCMFLPWNACTIDDRYTGGDSSTEQPTIPLTPLATSMQEIDAAETAMRQRWNTWQHATIVVVLPDATTESNPSKNSKKTLPYVFVPGTKNKLELMPLRTLLAQTRSQTFAVRHLLIDDAEAMPINVDKIATSSPLLGTVVTASVSSSTSASSQLSASANNLKQLSSNKRSCIQTSVVEFFSELYNLRHAESSTAVYERAQVVQLILHEPAMLELNRDSAQPPTIRSKQKIVTASSEYLQETFAERNNSATTAPKQQQQSKSELLPLFLASPAYLALYALYTARITHLLPRAQHTAEHLRDTGIIDGFLMSDYSLSDEVRVHFALPASKIEVK